MKYLGRRLRLDRCGNPVHFFLGCRMQEAHFDKWQFEDRLQQPVSAGTGIDYSDYSRMQTMRRKVTGERRLETPEWALDDKLLRQVIVEYLERRVYSAAYRRMNPEEFTGCPIQRLNRAERDLRFRKNPELLRTLDRLCLEYVHVKTAPGDPNRARMEKLEQEIRNVDTSFRFNERPGAYVAAIVYLYYRCGMDSVGTAAELGLVPAHVRQVTFRLNRAWKRLNMLPESERTRS